MIGDDALRKLAERTASDLAGYETAEAFQLARGVLRLLDERDEILLKDRGKTREINLLTDAERSLRAELAEARDELLAVRSWQEALVEVTEAAKAEFDAIVRWKAAALASRCEVIGGHHVVWSEDGSFILLSEIARRLAEP